MPPTYLTTELPQQGFPLADTSSLPSPSPVLPTPFPTELGSGLVATLASAAVRVSQQPPQQPRPRQQDCFGTTRSPAPSQAVRLQAPDPSPVTSATHMPVGDPEARGAHPDSQDRHL